MFHTCGVHQENICFLYSTIIWSDCLSLLFLSQAGGLAPKRRSLNIEQQLRSLGLAEFIGRQHSGIDVSTLFPPYTLTLCIPSLSI